MFGWCRSVNEKLFKRSITLFSKIHLPIPPSEGHHQIDEYRKYCYHRETKIIILTHKRDPFLLKPIRGLFYLEQTPTPKFSMVHAT